MSENERDWITAEYKKRDVKLEARQVIAGIIQFLIQLNFILIIYFIFILFRFYLVSVYLAGYWAIIQILFYKIQCFVKS